MDKKHLNFLLFEGLVFVILGILGITLPWFYTMATTLLIGWLLIVGGIVVGIRTIQRRKQPGFWPALIGTLILLGFGIWFVLVPKEGTLLLTVLLTIFFFIDGLFKIFLAFALRAAASTGWIALSGLISLAIAAIVWAGWPESTSWFIGLLIGINLLVFGLAQIAFAWRAKIQ